MKLTISMDLLEEMFYYVSPVKPVSTVPLIYATFLASKDQLAYTTENEAKFARKIERSFKAAFHEVIEKTELMAKCLIKIRCYHHRNMAISKGN